MTKIQYRNTNFHASTQARIDQLETILAEYEDQQLTARQVYYQFVARDWLPNTERNYKLITKLITDARYAGIVDWDQIEDRGREPSTPQEFDSIVDLVDTALRAYRLPRWDGQETYCELWVEKQALAGVLAPLARQFHVTLMVNKGYSSASAMKQSADRMREAQGACTPEFLDWQRIQRIEQTSLKEGSTQHKAWSKRLNDHVADNIRKVVVFYLGDHDPSGNDMVRDIEDRLLEFGVWRLEIKKLGLTMAQIKRHRPPPNPAKITDSRAKAYIREFGRQSWELDALPPRELNRLVTSAFEATIDRPMMDAIIAREDKDRERLRKAAEKLTRR